jgi:hypothetical protein
MRCSGRRADCAPPLIADVRHPTAVLLDSTAWKFQRGFDNHRRDELEKSADFSALTLAVAQEVTNFDYDVEPGNTPATSGCCRPVFILTIPRQTFDAFFNGPQGYRAQYLASPELGQAQNSHLLRTLEERLLSIAESRMTRLRMALDAVRNSLAANSAKVWIPLDDFFSTTPKEDLDIDSWRAAIQKHNKAIWGLSAPEASRLEIKGAFLDSHGSEVVPADKIRRRFDIHEFGFV